MAAKIEIIGMKELEKLLNSIPDSVAVDALRNINRAGGQEYKAEMQSQAPVGSDNIHRNIRIQNDPEDKTAIFIGVSNKAYWARFVEFGTKVRTTKGKGPIIYGKANRGQMKPEPFIAPSIEKATPRAIDSIFQKMGKRVTSYIKRYTKKISK